METQCEKVLKYMQDFGSVNPQQAIADLGVYRLASRISDLRKGGHKISRRMVRGKNRDGEAVRFAEYRLEENNAEQSDSHGPIDPRS